MSYGTSKNNNLSWETEMRGPDSRGRCMIAGGLPDFASCSGNMFSKGRRPPERDGRVFNIEQNLCMRERRSTAGTNVIMESGSTTAPR